MGNTLDYILRLQDKFTGPLRQARDEQGRFTAGVKSLGGSSGNVDKLGSAFGGLAMKIGAAFTAYKALEGGFSGFKHALSVASEMETTQTAFKTMLGSSSAMLETLGEIKTLAMSTPFEFPELANAGKMMLGLGIAAKEIPDTLRRVGDVASGIAAPIGEIAEQYAKMRSKTVIFTDDLNELSGRGIPVIREFAKILGVPETAIRKLAEEGKITFPLLDQAFRNLTGSGGQFFNMMAEQAKTSAGLWSTLKDGVNELFLALGTPLNDAVKPILTDAISLADQLKPAIAEIGTNMGTALGAMRDFIGEAKQGSGLAAAMGEALWKMIQDVAGKMMVPFKAAWAGMASLGKDLITWLTPVGEWLTAKMESAAFSFGRALMKQMAEVMASLPFGMGAAAAEVLNKSAKSANQAASVANSNAKRAEAKITPPSAEGVAGSLDKAMGATRGVIQDALDKSNAPNPNALPPSTLDKDYNPMFPGGVLPPGARAGKSTLPPSALDGPAAGGPPQSIFEQAKAKAELAKAGASGGTAAGLTEALAGAASTGKAATKPAAKPGPMAQAAAAAATSSGIDDGMTRRPGDGTAPMERVKTMMGGEDGGPLSARGTSGIRRRLMGGPDGGPLSSRRSAPNVPSPGTARRQQERREAAATASRGGGGGGGDHPLMGVIKEMQAKLNTLAVAK